MCPLPQSLLARFRVEDTPRDGADLTGKLHRFVEGSRVSLRQPSAQLDELHGERFGRVGGGLVSHAATIERGSGDFLSNLAADFRS